MSDPSEVEAKDRVRVDHGTRGTVILFRAVVLVTLLLTGCVSSGSRPPARPARAQSVEFVVLNGTQEALVLFALWDTSRSSLLGPVSSFSTGEFDIRLQGQAVALSIEPLSSDPRDDVNRGPRRAPSSDFVAVSDGDRIEWIVTDPDHQVEYTLIGAR